ncbi:MAG: hypothetical protein RJB66_1334 [Pseudomonadota bacterium]|jgi:hypothetical protein
MALKKRPNVLEEVRRATLIGRLIPSPHAQQQMAKRDIQMSDIEEAISRAKLEKKKDSLTDDKKEWKYALRGKNNEGDKDLRIIIMFDDPSAIIVTAIDKNKKED